MFSRFFGRGNRTAGGKRLEAQDTRGLEVVEDDPDTAWSKWADAVAEQESSYATTGSGELTAELNTSEADTVPAELSSGMTREQLQREARKNSALAVVDMYHQRIANTIRTVWGHKDCSAYINRLIMAGGDGMGHARVGFNLEAVQAMLELVDLHDSEFGPPDQDDGLRL
jgi:hypothetical protein